VGGGFSSGHRWGILGGHRGYDASVALIEKYAVNSPSMNTLIENLNHLPVDIKPVFQIEKNVSTKIELY